MKPMRVYTTVIHGIPCEVKVYASGKVIKESLTKKRYGTHRTAGEMHIARENGQFKERS